MLWRIGRIRSLDTVLLPGGKHFVQVKEGDLIVVVCQQR
jgi:hypothetical protein